MKGKEEKPKHEKEQQETIQRIIDMKNYLLTYLECSYGAFIAVFIGIVAVPFLPISSMHLRVILVLSFWIVGLYFLGSIIQVYGQLWIAYGLSETLDEKISQEIRKLGFPYNYLEKIFYFLRKPFLGKLNLRYVISLVVYVLLLVVFLVIVTTNQVNTTIL